MTFARQQAIDGPFKTIGRSIVGEALHLTWRRQPSGGIERDTPK